MGGENATASPQRTSGMRPAGVLRRVLITLSLLMLIGAIFIAVALPIFAAGFIRGALEAAVAPHIDGALRVTNISLGWLGPQRVSVVVDDARGERVADVSVSTSASLIGLAMGNYDLSRVRVDGEVKMVRLATGEVVVAGARTTAEPVVLAPGEQPVVVVRSGIAPEPFEIPRSLKMQLDGTGLRLVYESHGLDGSVQRAGLVADRLTGSFDGMSLRLDLDASTLEGAGKLAVRVQGDVADGSGRVDLGTAASSISVDGELPTSLLEVAMGGSAEATADDMVRMSGTVVTSAGMFGYGEGGMIEVSGRLPESLVRMFADDALMLERAPELALRVPVLSVPLRGSLEGALLVATLTASEMSGRYGDRGYVAGPVEAMAEFTGSPREARFEVKPFPVSIDGEPSGMVSAEGMAGDFARDGAGGLLLSSPGSIEAVVRAENIPGALVDAFARIEGVRIEELLDGAADAVVRVSMRDRAWMVPVENALGEAYEAPAPANQPVIVARVDAPGLIGRGSAALDVDRLIGTGPGIDILTTRPMALFDAPLEEGTTLDMERLRLTALGFEVPVRADVALGAVRLNGALQADGIAVTDASGETVPIPSALGTIRMVPGESARWMIVATGVDRGRDFGIRSEGIVSGLTASAGVPLAEQLRMLRPQGSVTMADVPTVLARFISEDAEAIAQAVFGGMIRGSVSGAMAQESDRVDVALDVAGPGGGVRGDAQLADGVLLFGGEGVSLTTRDLEGVLRALKIGDDPLRTSGSATVRLSDARVPLGGFDSFAPLAGIWGVVEVESDDLAIGVVGDDASVRMDRLLLRGALAEDGLLEASWSVRGASGSGPMGGAGTLRVDRLHRGDGVPDVSEARLSGTGGIDGIPKSMIEAFIDDEELLETIAAIGDRTLGMQLATLDEGAPNQSLGITLTSREALELSTRVRIFGGMLRIEGTGGRLMITPGLVEALFGEALDELTPRPSLASSVPATVSLMDIRMPLRNRWLPSYEPGVRIAGQLRIQEEFIARNAFAAMDGTIRDVRVGDFTLGFTANADDPLENGLSGSLVAFEPGRGGGQFADVSWSMVTPASIGVSEFALRRSDTGMIDRLLGFNGWLAEVLGNDLRIASKALARTLPETSPEPPVMAEARSERLSARAVLDHRGERIRLLPPAEVLWLMRPQLMTRLLGADSGVRLEGNVPFESELHRANIGHGEHLFAAEDFEIGAIARRIGEMVFIDRYDQRSVLPPSAAFVRLQGTPAQLDFQWLSAEEREEGDRPALLVEGVVTRLGDDEGRPTIDRANIESLKAFGSLPTALVDALMNQGGALTELLGPDIQADIVCTNISRTEGGGTMEARLRSANARALMLGDVVVNESGAVLRLRPESNVRVDVISPATTGRLLGRLLPMLASFEKTAAEEPMLVSTTGLSIPIDGNMQLLNGTMKIDPGTVRFETIRLVARLLEATRNNPRGLLGERLEPFEVVFENGVAKFERFRIPTGEFSFEVSGSVDLVRDRMDVRMFVPVYALSRELAPALSAVPGLERLTMVPVRLTGPTAQPQVDVDVQMLLLEAPRSLLDGTGEILDRTGGELLRGVFGLPDIFRQRRSDEDR